MRLQVGRTTQTSRTGRTARMPTALRCCGPNLHCPWAGACATPCSCATSPQCVPPSSATRPSVSTSSDSHTLRSSRTVLYLFVWTVSRFSQIIIGQLNISDAEGVFQVTFSPRQLQVAAHGHAELQVTCRVDHVCKVAISRNKLVL